ncbi:MAG TPA: hypothetical protein VM778_05145 [Gemmatimonadota bacterium]|nr:hypothetical protein [Gemmatimonadota bacterium]
MTRKKPANAATTIRVKSAPVPAVSFTRVNAAWLGAGAIVIVVGYILLARGGTTLAALLLVLGYCVLLPVGIVKK